jgi:hypothetical protein
MRNIYLIILLLLTTAVVTQAQSDSAKLASIAAKLEKLSGTTPVEKVYLHLNKPNYNIGDTIWLKAYVTIGEHHLPSALSGLIYVELIDYRDKILRTLRLKNTNGIAIGDIAIDEKQLPGTYRIRAYTNWMRNAGPDYFFVQHVNIGNSKTSAIFVTSTIDAPAPTGDGPVKGSLTYTDKFGRPLDHKSIAYEIKADTVIVFKGTGTTDDKGILSFAFNDKSATQKRLSVDNHISLTNSVIIAKTIPLVLPKESADVQFFPEGGQLISGVRSKIAFKAIGTNGLGIDVKGTVLDNDGTAVAYFSTAHAGMGIFALTPMPGKTYTAKITLLNSTIINIKLPMAADKGFVLGINNSDSANVTIRISTNQATLQGMRGTPFYLVGQSSGMVYFATMGKLDEAVFAATVPKAKFPTGITQFTLFNANNEPLNERIAFIQNNNNLLSLSLGTEKNTYKTKEQVNLNVNAKNGQDKPAEGSFSLSVFNEDRLAANEDAESTILSNMLLTSDIKGYIEDPNYYFNTKTDQAKADLDVLMLTQGYRRFEWKEILADRYPTIAYQPEKGIDVSGVLTTPAGKPVDKGRLSILALSDKIIIDTVSDAEGKFKLTDVAFTDSIKLVLKARKANDGRNVNISLDGRKIPLVYKSNMADVVKNITPPYLSMQIKGNADTAQMAAIAKTSDNIHQLKDVKITAKKAPISNQISRYGTVSQFTVPMAQAREYNSVYDAIQWRIPGVTFKMGRLYYEDSLITTMYVNELAYNINYAQILDPADIESITLAGTIPIVTTKAFAGTDTIKVKSLSEIQGKLLNEIAVKGRKGTGANAPWMAIVTRSANLNGPGHADFIFSSKDLLNCVDFVNCIINKLPGIQHTGDNYYFLRHMSQSLTAPPPIRFMLDGLMLDNLIPLETVNATDIESVEVLNNNALLSSYGSEASGGLVIVTTKIGSDNNDATAFKSVPGVIYTRFNGYYKAKEFYTPKYTATNNALPDSRTAIYWNPNITTTAGTATVNYFNSDAKGTYRAVIEGIDNDGNIGRYVYRYRVE